MDSHKLCRRAAQTNVRHGCMALCKVRVCDTRAEVLLIRMQKDLTQCPPPHDPHRAQTAIPRDALRSVDSATGGPWKATGGRPWRGSGETGRKATPFRAPPPPPLACTLPHTTCATCNCK